MNSALSKHLVTMSLALTVVSGACGKSLGGDTPEGPSIAEIGKGGGCPPKDNMARILKSANPLDSAPNRSKNNWNELDVPAQGYVVTELDGGIFLQVDLVSPEGGTRACLTCSTSGSVGASRCENHKQSQCKEWPYG